jgi:cell division protein FtsB
MGKRYSSNLGIKVEAQMNKIIVWLGKNKAYVFTIGISFVIFMFMLNSLFTIQLKIENASQNETISELENRLKSAKQENQKLQTDIYIEQEATERLSMVKSSEMPIKVIEYKEEETGEKEKDKMNEEKTSIYLTEWYDLVKEKVKQK